MMYLATIWMIEYSCGEILARVLGDCPWHYSGYFNVGGYINLRMVPEWFVVGLGFEVGFAHFNEDLPKPINYDYLVTDSTESPYSEN